MMRDQYPPSNMCDFCEALAEFQSNDGADLCEACRDQEVTFCSGCKASMVWDTTIWKTIGMKCYCQTCVPQTEDE